MTIYSTLSDLSARIKNGQRSRKLEIQLKKTNKTLNILKVLQTEGYIRGYTLDEKNITVFFCVVITFKMPECTLGLTVWMVLSVFQ